MRKILIFIAALALTFTLAGCERIVEVEKIVEVEVEVEVEVPMEWSTIPATMEIDDVDDYLGRPDVQYVDLRDFDDKMSAGYIAGFEMIPFFDYLAATDILVRTDGDWTFAAEDIVSESALRALFNEDKTIFLMCGSGTRAGFVLAALEELGYTDVINVGGIGTYTGDFLVSGDGVYVSEVSTLGDYTPGVYFGFDPTGLYNATVVIGKGGGITEVFLDAQYGDSTKQELGFDYGMTVRSDLEWFEHANLLSDFLVANQGWDGIALLETAFDETWNALTVPHHFIDIDPDNSPDAVAGVSIGVEGFVLAWNDAIAQATEAGTLGLVDIDITPEQWAAAHVLPIEYTPGIYLGVSVGLYTALVVIDDDGYIESVFFDAVSCSRDSDGDEVNDADCTTKQLLGDDYGMVAYGGADLEWYEQANELAAAIVDAQGWNAAWAMIVDGSHDKFDVTDEDVIDDVAGVTIGVEGFKEALEDALDQAIPAA